VADTRAVDVGVNRISSRARSTLITVGVVSLLASACAGDDRSATLVVGPDVAAVETPADTIAPADTVAPITAPAPTLAPQTTVAPVDTTVVPVDTTAPAVQADAGAPAGYTVVDRSADGYTLAVPASWVEITEEQIRAWGELGAEATGLDANSQQIAEAALAGGAVFAVFDIASGESVSVLTQPTETPVRLASGVIRTQYEQAGGTDVIVDDSRVDEGRLTLSVTLGGARLDQLLLSGNGMTVVVSVNAASPEVAATVFDSVTLV
jgi:hypothetical protein